MLPIALVVQGAEFIASMFHKKPATPEPLYTTSTNDPSSSDTATLSASNASPAAPTLLSKAEGGLDLAASALMDFPLPLSPTASSIAGAYTLSRALFPSQSPGEAGPGNFVGLSHALDLSGSIQDESSGGYD